MRPLPLTAAATVTREWAEGFPKLVRTSLYGLRRGLLVAAILSRQSPCERLNTLGSDLGDQHAKVQAMIVFAAAGLLVGIFLWFVAVASEVTTPGTSTINLGLLSQREMLVIAGGFLITCGIILGAVDMLDKRLRDIARLLRTSEMPKVPTNTLLPAELAVGSDRETALDRLANSGYRVAPLPTQEGARLP